MRDKQAGFTLIELALVLAIVGLIVGMGARFGAGYLDGKRHEATNITLDSLEEALVRFVAATGRLPCPANISLTTASANYGREDGGGMGTCNSNQNDGVVPWVTLGFSQSAVLDGWGRYITYRVDEALTNVDAMDFKACTVGDLAGCALGNANATNGLLVQDGIGNPILNPAGGPMPTGAAYVLISHGRNGLGAYLLGRNDNPNPGAGIYAGDPAANELPNSNNTNVLDPDAGEFYVLRERVETNDASHFDDLVRARSVLALAALAGLVPP